MISGNGEQNFDEVVEQRHGKFLNSKIARVGVLALSVLAACVPINTLDSTPSATDTVPGATETAPRTKNTDFFYPRPRWGTTTTTLPDADCQIAAVGDIVGAGSEARASAVADLIVAEDVDAALLPGDLAYPSGTYEEFMTYFHPNFGIKLKDKIWPSIGSHEHDSGGVGYYQYFQELGRPVTANYVTQICGWNIISVDSEVAISAGAQLINNTRLADPNTPMLVFWHNPRYSSGLHGSDTSIAPLWNAADAAKAEVITVHDHHYERVQVGSTTQFVVGTGGHQPRGTQGSPVAGSQKIIAGSEALGALFMDLNPDGSWTSEWKYANGTVGDIASGMAD